MQIQNSAIINLIKNVINYNDDGTHENILTFDSLDSKSTEIDKYINQKTAGAISDGKEYKMFIEVFSTLNLSRISCINGLPIWVHDSTSKVCNCISCRYNRFEFDKIVEILNKIQFNSLDYTDSLNDETLARLLRGFYASKLGLIRVAYEEFQKVRQLAKTNKREILYFIACYNLKNLPYYFDYENWDFYKNEAEKIDLKTTLNSLSVSEEVRNELDAIINDKYIYSYANIIRKLNDKIAKVFKLYQNGGHQLGGNVYRDLATNFLIIYEFYHRNRLIDTEYGLFSEFVEICMEGLITNASTPEAKTKTPFDGYERIKEFDLFFIRAMIFYCDSDRLEQILNKLEERKIQISNDGGIRFIENFKNFLSSFYTTETFGNIVKNERVTTLTDNSLSNSFHGKCNRIFLNSIALLNRIEISNERKKEILTTLLNFLKIQNLGVFHESKNWIGFVKNNFNLFTLEQQKQFVLLVLTQTWYRSEIIIYYITQQLSQDTIILDELPKLNKERVGDYISSMGYLYKYSSEEVQKVIFREINDYFIKNLNELEFYKLYSYDCFNKEQFFELIIEKNSVGFTGIFDVTNYALSNFLCFIGKNEIDISKPELIQMSRKCQYINWLFDFDNFEYDNFNLSWFEYKPTIAFLDKMKNNEIIKKRLEEYLKSDTSVERNKNLTYAYFNYFVN